MSRLKIVNLLREARRRRVFRTAGLYIAGAFILLQGVDLALPALDLPESTIRLVWIAAILGMPIALILGWRYELADGKIFRSTPTGDESLALTRVDYLIIFLMMLLTAAIMFRIGAEIGTTESTVSTKSSTDQYQANSIAILPFDNISPEHSIGDALALGIQDGLLTQLSKISSLKVISRTSTEQYKIRAISIPEIGKELDVVRILEGSVQIVDDKMRINVQLINAIADEHLWADTFDVDLTATDIFSVQNDITRKVAAQLRQELSARDISMTARVPTTNIDAYMAYLNGIKELEKQSFSTNDYAIDHFATAIERDPNYAVAYLGLARAYLASSVEHRLPLAENSLAKAFELDDEVGGYYAVLGYLRANEGKYDAAERAFTNATKLEPGNAIAYQYYGKMRLEQGKSAEAISLVEQAFELDPYSASVNYDLGRMYDLAEHYDEAMARYQRSRSLAPDHYFVKVYIAALHYMVYGNVAESIYWYHKAAESNSPSSSVQSVPAIAYLELGFPDGAQYWVERGMRLEEASFFSLFTRALLAVYRGSNTDSVDFAHDLLDTFPQSASALVFLRNADLTTGRYEVALSRYGRAHPELAVRDAPRVKRSNLFAAIDLALVYKRLGDEEQAGKLLAEAERIVSESIRLGTNGYWICDVQVYALQGRTERALEALAEAIEEGWRVKTWYFLNIEPNLDSIRNEPEFQRLKRHVEKDLADQARLVEDLIESGEIEDVRVSQRRSQDIGT